VSDRFEKWFRKENLVVMILAGILLIVIALPTKKQESKVDLSAEMLQEMEYAKEYAAQSTEQETRDGYVEMLENKLADILSHIQGIGDVYVMITLQEQTAVEGEESVYVPNMVKTVYPKVEGVVIVAQGAGTGRVTQTIIEAVQALFDIEIHKIKVAAG